MLPHHRPARHSAKTSRTTGLFKQRRAHRALTGLRRLCRSNHPRGSSFANSPHWRPHRSRTIAAPSRISARRRQRFRPRHPLTSPRLRHRRRPLSARLLLRHQARRRPRTRPRPMNVAARSGVVGPSVESASAAVPSAFANLARGAPWFADPAASNIFKTFCVGFRSGFLLCNARAVGKMAVWA